MTSPSVSLIPPPIAAPRVHPADESVRFEVLPRDLGAYRLGNMGVPYAFRFDSGVPGPRVGINGLTHGNEFCGMTAVCALIDAALAGELKPERGVLSLSLANVAAYESFQMEVPFDSRMLVHNMNRIWSAAELGGDVRSPDLDRARAMRPVFDGLHSLLDIHSTSQCAAPFHVYPERGGNAALASGIGFPPIHLVMPGGMQTGTPLIEYAAFQGGAVVIECGQHFAHSAGVLATQASLAFLAFHGALSRARCEALSMALTGSSPWGAERPAPQRFRLLSTHVIQTTELRWTRPLIGGERFARGELIGTDGALELRAPCDDCTVFMPLGAGRAAVPGREGIYLTEPMHH